MSSTPPLALAPSSLATREAQPRPATAVAFLPPRRERRTRRRAPSAIRAVLALTAGAAVSFATLTYMGTAQRHALHTAPLHKDGSRMDLGTSRTLADLDVALVLKDEGGTVRRVMARKSELAAFVNETLVGIDRERALIIADVERDVAGLIEAAFADREQAIGQFAAWQFAWGRSLRLLYESLSSAVAHVPRSAFSRERIEEAMRHGLEAYYLRHYRAFILKPDIRDPVIAQGVETILRNAHGKYVRTVAAIDLRLQVFLATRTTHLDPSQAARVGAVELDWDAQRWKAPRYRLEDDAVRAVFRGTQFAAVAGLVAKTVGPAIEAQVLKLFALGIGRMASMLGARVAQGAAGTWLLGPGTGTLAGIGAGVLFDWGTNRLDEHWNRPDFEAANRAAVAATMTTWRQMLTSQITSAVDVWLDDTRGAVASQELGAGPIHKSQERP